MTPYTHTGATGRDIKVHTNDVYTIVTIEGVEVLLSPAATGELLLWILDNSQLGPGVKERIKDYGTRG